MPRVPIAEIRRKMLRALEVRGLTDEHAVMLVDEFLDAELEGKLTHGVGKFLLMDRDLADRGGPAHEIVGSDSFTLVNARKEIGQIAAAECIELLKPKVKQVGIATVGMVNFSRLGRLSPYGRMLANEGLVGIIMSSAGPPVVSPYGGVNPMLGTNPICFAFPVSDGPMVIDLSTGTSVWGEIRQATLENRPLPEGTFLDPHGDFTTDPKSATSVIPFGGPKGYALCLALEVLCGALVTAKMGPRVESQYDIGFLAIGIDPGSFGVDQTLPAELNELVCSIRNAKAQAGVASVHVPGERSKLRREQAVSEGVIDIADATWSGLLRMHEGLSSGMTID